MEPDCPHEITPGEAISLWIEHFRAAVAGGSSEREIAKLMAAEAFDAAWIYHGASGRRSRIYRIDDCVQARFDFDHQGALTSYAVYPLKERWLKGPGGVLLSGFEAADAELLFP